MTPIFARQCRLLVVLEEGEAGSTAMMYGVFRAFLRRGAQINGSQINGSQEDLVQRRW